MMVAFHPHFSGEQTEAQTGSETCSVIGPGSDGAGTQTQASGEQTPTLDPHNHCGDSATLA